MDFRFRPPLPESNCICSGQVLTEPYRTDLARNVILEMADNLALDLLDKGLVTDQLVLDIGYDRTTLMDKTAMLAYHGAITVDHYGRQVPKPGHGSQNLEEPTSSASVLDRVALEIWDRIVQPNFYVRRLTITANHVIPEAEARKKALPVQGDLFSDPEVLEQELEVKAAQEEKERKVQETILDIKKKFGKNAILKGMNFEEGATIRTRNQQIGGHKA